MSLIRIVLALAAGLDLEIEQLDIKITLLHVNPEEEIYINKQEGFEVTG